MSLRREDSPHVFLVSYHFPPGEGAGVRRVLALRDALERLGVRTTVVTSSVSGRAEADGRCRVERAPDLRSLAGLKPLVGSARRRWWSRLVVPDATAVSWAPAAAVRALRLARRDRPDAVFTSSPPESAHLVGLALARLGIFWVADFRDGWTFEPPTLPPYACGLNRRLERLVARRASALTAVTAPLADHLRRLGGGRPVLHLPNGFAPALVASAADESASLDPSRFSLVHTGTLELNGKSARPLYAAVEGLLGERPELAERLEIVLAGPLADADRANAAALRARGILRELGQLEHSRSLGLQRAADGLLLITPPRSVRDASTVKVYEYLATGRPILALAGGSSAEDLVRRAGPHTIAPPDDAAAVAAALREFLGRWLDGGEEFAPDPSFPLGDYSYDRIARRLVELFAEIRAFTLSA